MSAAAGNRGSDAMLELALDAAGLNLWEMDVDSRKVIRTSAQAMRGLGYTRDEWRIGSVEDLYLCMHPDDVPLMAGAITRHVNGETSQYRCEFRLRAKNGDWVWHSAYGRIIDRAGPDAGRRLVGVTFNIDERKRMEVRLAELLTLNQKTVALSPVGVLAYKVEGGECVMANEAVAAIVGGTVEQLRQQKFRHISSWQENGMLGMAQEVLRGEGRQSMSVHLLSTFGKEAWVDVTMASFVSYGEQCLLVMMDDVTDHKRALAELSRARNRAEEASRAKSTFLANMSHEIRTPMNTIIGMTQLALRNARDPAQHDYLTKIQQSGEHLLGIIDDLLDFSRIDAGKMALDDNAFEIADVRRNLLDQFEWKAAERKLRLSFDLAPDVPPMLSGDILRLSQVLINLVSNALKFTMQGEVAVSARRIEETDSSVMLRFEVRDSGIGIDPAQRDQLFSPFYQKDSSFTRHYGGSGLGLTISRKLVELFGGEIGVDSTAGQGSVFWFTARFGKVRPAPAPRTARSAQEMQELGAAVAAIKGARVLLAEDHAFNQQVAMEFLNDAGAAVCVANNGEEALDLLRHQVFECVLMDVQMPVMDGLEAARQIRIDPALAQIPIIALTANVLGEDRDRCLEAGMNDFIGKPFRIAEFYTTLAAWLGGRKKTAAAAGEERVQP
ncbi:MAG TPA: ATP-binding protein [Gallionellaceae bacterium]|nr:ATP-binding protein [Gallionellaceae bacterium]